MSEAERERAAVVAWLRAGERSFSERAVKSAKRGHAASARSHEVSAGHYRCIAECIEDGAHLQEQSDEQG